MTELNVYTWFSNRELNYIPAHFVVVDTLITQESKQWILEKLTGRFCLVEIPNYTDLNIASNPWAFGYSPAFENPQEATYFQLMWN
jgi:hypothetical protein